MRPALAILRAVAWGGALLLAAPCGAGAAVVEGAMPERGVIATLWEWAPLIGRGLLMNLFLSVLAMAIGTACGLFLGLAIVSHRRFVSRPATWVTQFFRNAPWLVLLFFAILTLPYEIRLGDTVVPLPAWVKATIGLALPVMANVAEIVRGGVQSIPSAQWESAEALAFSRSQILWLVILPQSLKRMLPPWMNLYAVLTMATPLVSVVGVEEAMTLARYALSAENRTELVIPMYLLLLLAFFLYCYPIARLTGALERRFAVRN